MVLCGRFSWKRRGIPLAVCYRNCKAFVGVQWFLKLFLSLADPISLQNNKKSDTGGNIQKDIVGMSVFVKVSSSSVKYPNDTLAAD